MLKFFKKSIIKVITPVITVIFISKKLLKIVK